MATPIIMPKFGQMTEESAIVEWCKKEGDPVAKGDILFTVETDKSVMEVESFEAGTLLKILVKPGVSVPVQSTVGFLGQPGEAIPQVAAPPAPPHTEQEQQAQPPAEKLQDQAEGKAPTELELAAQRMEELSRKLAEAEDKSLRLRADIENQRKRYQKEICEARIAARADTLLPMLTVFDHVKMAVDSAEQGHDYKVLFDGMKIIMSEFRKAMEDLGVEELNEAGKDFDPKLHEAVAKQPSDEVPEGRIISQWRSGYRMGDRLLRPCAVIVSGGAESPEDKPMPDPGDGAQAVKK